MRALRATRPLTVAEAHALGDPAVAGSPVRDAVGCVFCKQSGYAGRLGLFECFATDEELCAGIARGSSEADLAARARERGARSLRDDARIKILAGQTSVAEALRVVEAG